VRRAENQEIPKHLGIALRIALLSWIVAMMTLLIFVFVTLPQQKQFFIRNLDSKANGVAVSLHEAAAGAAVNEDFASVVTAGGTLVNGDPELDFLIISKNDGFSLIIETDRWRAEPRIDPFWLPVRREAVGQIEVVPLNGQRVYHFAQPFDYSGIEWGWIHVGLSLKNYDQSVALLHRNTLLLALACISFSLLASLLYAKRLVRPILRLQRVLGRIAGGDLSVRADTERNDEMGSLAQSVNAMADALSRRDRILESIRFAAQRFVQTDRWETVIEPVLEKIGEAAGVSRAYLFQNFRDARRNLCCAIRYEWTAPEVPPKLNHPALRHFSFHRRGVGRCRRRLAQNRCYGGKVSTLGKTERDGLISRDIRSILLMPVFVDGAWWGILGLDECRVERDWTDAEIDSLRAGADMLGATIARQRARDALLESKSTLEERVAERTREFQEQYQAKERALAELASAQSSLMEMSRAAGMAEVATGVLHNVGNVLNSVNVSCTLLMEQLQGSRVANLARIADMLKNPEGGMAHFLTEDRRGREIPGYLARLTSALEAERSEMMEEAKNLRERMGHIKEIVDMQQSYGRVSGVRENLEPERLMEDALKLNAEALVRHGITVKREYRPAPPITVEKHKVLQILLNLINNAKYACGLGPAAERNITLRIQSPGSERLFFEIEDNGIGIPKENLTRIFRHGFTTRKTGHGFGLHSGALGARELGGRLRVHSDGPGRGAVFTLELPYNQGNAL
jgi:signal transduction histidine kinase